MVGWVADTKYLYPARWGWIKKSCPKTYLKPELEAEVESAAMAVKKLEH